MIMGIYPKASDSVAFPYENTSYCVNKNSAPLSIKSRQQNLVIHLYKLLSNRDRRVGSNDHHQNVARYLGHNLIGQNDNFDY